MPDDEPDPAQPPARRARRRRPPRPAPAGAEDLPQPRIVEARRWNVSLVWLLPAVAVAIGASLLVRSVFLIGPRIDIEFASAEGVEAGKTEVRYKEVVIGKVQSVSLRDDRQRRRRRRPARPLGGAASRSRTRRSGWSGRASASPASPASARCSRAPTSAPMPASRPRRGPSSRASRRRRSCCAASRARSSSCAPSTSARSTSARRCSIGARRVGRVVGYTLDAERDELSVRIFIEAPYQKLVTLRTRASGMRAASTSRVNASGLNPQHPDARVGARRRPRVRERRPMRRAAAGARRTPSSRCSADRTRGDGAARRPAGAGADGVRPSVRGLRRRRGDRLARRRDRPGRRRSPCSTTRQRKRFPVEVFAEVFPQRLGSGSLGAAADLADAGGAATASSCSSSSPTGVRAQLRTGNLLTGQLYVALDFIGKEPAQRGTEATAR